MTAASSTVPEWFLALSLPRLATDRIRRERLGRSWRSKAGTNPSAPRFAAFPDGEGDGGRHAPLLPVPLGAGNGHRPAAGALSTARLPKALRPSATEMGEGDAPPAPLALFERIAQADRIVALCEQAQALGLGRGLGVAEARARFPELELLPADPSGTARLLDALADWCDRYTPLVALDGADGLVLDISGCAHLFGGLEPLQRDLLARLHAQGFAARAAIAAHPGTARALAGHAPGIVPAGGEEAAVGALPVAALRLEPDLAARLLRLGLKRVGDLLALPRAALVRRFGPGLARRLDEAVGRARAPLSPRRPVPLLICERRLFEPVSLAEDILRLAAHLAARLREGLEARGEGARCLELVLFRVDGRVERLPVRTGAPLRDPVRIEKLFAERLKALGDDLDAGFGYDLVKLCVTRSEPMAPEQASLSDEEEDCQTGLNELLDRLGARLGEACVFGLEGVESHRPERAQRRHAPAVGAVPPVPFSGPLRPLRLFAPPEPVDATAEVPDGPIRQFRWRRAFYRVERIEGPERIAPEWWREDACAERDYFRIEDEEGRRYWMFRQGVAPERPSHWFLHGIFA